MFLRNTMMIGMDISLCPCKSTGTSADIERKLTDNSEDFLTEIIRQR
jgi:hypothetical protein